MEYDRMMEVYHKIQENSENDSTPIGSMYGITINYLIPFSLFSWILWYTSIIRYIAAEARATVGDHVAAVLISTAGVSLAKRSERRVIPVFASGFLWGSIWGYNWGYKWGYNML